jgi:glycolate oxidase iron-sulfur subunit
MVKTYPEHIINYEDQIYHCTRCGLCQSVCPVFDAVKTELSVARGKVALLQGLLSDKLSFSRKMASYLELCTGCMACKEICPSGISSDLIFQAAKEYAASKYGLSLPKKAIVETFSSEHALSFFSTLLNLYTTTKAGFIADNISFNLPFIDKLKLLNSQVNGKTGLKLKNIHIKQVKPAYRLIYFPGCINQYVNSSVAKATLDILEKNNIEVVVPDQFYCCGMPALMSGQVESAKELALRNLEIINTQNLSQYDYIVVDCGSCSYMLKYYEKLFNDNPQYQEKFSQLKEKIIDVNAFIVNLDIKLPTITEEITVTYHDPCHLRRSQSIYKEPRALIKSINNINYVEMPEAESCCGASGSFCITHPEVSKQISIKKALNIESTGADIVLTSCPSCKVGIMQGGIAINKTFRVYHPVEIIHRYC